MLLVIGVAVLTATLLARVAGGRSTVEHAAAAHWRTLGPGMLAALAIAIILPLRLRTLDPRRHVSEAWGVPSATWMLVQAHPWWFPAFDATYLVEGGADRWLRLGVEAGECVVVSPTPVFSADGRVAAWSEARDDEAPRRVFTCRLDEPALRARRLRSARSDGSMLDLSPTGELLLVRNDTEMNVVALATDRVVHATSGIDHVRASRIDDAGSVEFATTSSPLRGWSVPVPPLVVAYRWSADADRPRASRLALPAGLQPGTSAGGIAILDGSRCIVRWWQRSRRIVSLHDLADGRVVALLYDGPGGGRPRVLRDGRIVTVSWPNERTAIAVFGADGALQRRIDLDAEWFDLIGERAPGELVACDARNGRRLLVIDVGAGRVIDEVEGLTCAGESTRVFRDTSIDDERRSLVLLDWATHARRPAFP